MEDLLADLQRAGVRLSVEGDELRIAAPKGALTGTVKEAVRANKDALMALLRAQGSTTEAFLALTADVAARAQPFPLTDLQHAYWVGRDASLEMGGVATHLYLELHCPGLDVARLNEAWCKLIDRHDMLRAVVEGDGMQRILPEVPPYRIAIHDCRAAQADVQRSAIETTRTALSHQVLSPPQWPLFDIRATLLPEDCVRLHVSLDLLILDAVSIAVLFREWRRWYDEPAWTPAPLQVSFRDYVLAERRMRDSAALHRAHDYWMARVDTLPAAPALPLRADRAAGRVPRFHRREARLAPARWAALQAKARHHGITPSCLLLAAYSAVLSRWSATAHFTVNVVVSHRQPVHPDVRQMLGDFAAPLLHEVDWRDARKGFLTLALSLQERFISDFAHAQVSGVAVLREWARRRNSTGQALMPVVFSSGLMRTGEEAIGDLEPFGSTSFSVSQTPQVWLDHHVREVRGELIYNWDAVEAVFEDGVLDAMFGAYQALVEELAEDDAAWTRAQTVPLPATMQHQRERGCSAVHAVPDRSLHASLMAQALLRPDALAVISCTRSMTYRELLAESAAAADVLIERDMRPGEPVAVLMRKGWEQIVAVYGVLLAKGAYLPVDAELPPRRQMDLLRQGGVKQVLVQPGGIHSAEALAAAGLLIHEIRPGTAAPLRPRHLGSLGRSLDHLAYVIFTSGTTGVPKGVMVSHGAAMNTVLHVNELIGAGPQDRMLAVSSLSFDLSVYDIFGMHAAGGAVVLPDHRRAHDPAHWHELMVTHGVTRWNSAPQLMRMLLDHLLCQEPPAALQTALLSGDFIPLDLPDRIRARYPGAQVISLGGATEAAIWSIYHPIDAVRPEWTSIPYGRPLPNQSVWVGDTALQPCPDHVRGRIFIGGLGLAEGYSGAPELTAERFITHPDTGQRLYDTGDIGCHAADGSVIILGRDDGQVKIRGHRVEVGEVEAVLREHPSVAQAVVRAVGDTRDSRRLVAHVEPVRGESVDPQALRHYLADRLPEYMVPQAVVLVERMPLSANGKLDTSALPAPLQAEEVAVARRVAPRTPAEHAVLAVWSRVLPDAGIGVTDNFFDVGGDSILATVLVRELNTVLPFTLKMHDLFEHLTVEALAGLWEQRTAVEPGVTGETQVVEDQDHEAMYADIDAAQAMLNTMAPDVRLSDAPPRAVLLTGATGWLGSHLLEALLSRTSVKVCCLVRAGTPAEGEARLLDALRRHGIDVPGAWQARIEPVCGDLTAPGLGLDAGTWRRIAEQTDAVYHLAASINALQPYATHRHANVTPLMDLVRLVTEHHAKRMFFSSPMTVCRRRLDGELVVFGNELPSDDPRGLLTGYARSKWTGEKILLTAARRLGLPLTIYRTSHALPTARGGIVKPKDTYVSVLQAALAAGVIPDEQEARFHGVPTDLLAELLVDDSLACDGSSKVVHLDNPDPPTLASVITLLLEDAAAARPLPAAHWRARCREVAETLQDRDASLLTSALFASTSSGTSVENMFSPHPIETSVRPSAGRANLTPEDYWRRLRRSLVAPRDEGDCPKERHGVIH